MSQSCTTPKIFKHYRPAEIVVGSVNLDSLTQQAVQELLGTCNDGALGIAPVYGSNCSLKSLTISSATRVLHIKLSGASSKNLMQRKFLQQLLTFPTKKFALKMDVLATSLHLDVGIVLAQGIDMLSASKGERHSREATLNALGGEANLDGDEVDKLFFSGNRAEPTVTKLGLTAWTICKAATYQDPAPAWKLINTQTFPTPQLAVLSKLVRDAQRLQALKPTTVANDVNPSFTTEKSGEVRLQSTRYKTRLRTSNNMTRVVADVDGKQVESIARVKKVEGRDVRLHFKSPLQGEKIVSVTTLGRDPLTLAEQSRESVVLEALQRQNTILSSYHVQYLWSLPLSGPAKVSAPIPTTLPIHPPARPLNASQTQAVSAILASGGRNDDIIVIHGPPGTGKTTVIATAVVSFHYFAPNRTVWLVAQSNVAVKNIAEKLASQKFEGFRILVSKEFHFDWHEHLYENLERKVIRSDSFAKTAVEAESHLLGSQVILCTLSMFSNPQAAVYTRLVPVETVIFDEASQIEIGSYIPMLSSFQQSLKKLVFIGDDKQLPPHGESDVDGLQSIFELKHVRKNAIFLDTQYRMPVVIGEFISKHVYEGKLKTVHPNDSKKSCVFVDVSAGEEKQQGTSWFNLEEVRTVVETARLLVARGKSFRIITPYDAQRSKLESSLKAQDLPWENKCFNVDAFQGNEDDHILISLVRSNKIGFLKEARRVNVMLTRCKQMMVICTSRAFVRNIAGSTLVGKLAAELGDRGWATASKLKF